MPVLPVPPYTPAFPFTNGHLQTLYPSLFRRKPILDPLPERLETDDGDFIDIDWHVQSKGSYSPRLAVISHGLEGHSRRGNMLGMAACLVEQGWDVICLNFRGCSGEMNRLPRLYHSGVTDDLHRVLCHGLAAGDYAQAALLGFSMGGNQTLKYLGESADQVPQAVKAAVVFSVPVQLADSAALMGRWYNRIYMKYFMSGLKKKVRLKAQLFPKLYDTTGLAEMKTFAAFDDKYTGPVHGFQNGADYYAKCSAKQFLPAIEVPTLLVQAQDDPFLPQSCYPVKEAEDNKNLFLEIPRYGGHVGFIGKRNAANYWMEDRTVCFLDNILGPSHNPLDLSGERFF